MIETTVLNYLLENLNVPVYMEVPESPSESFVVIEKTGSSAENKIYTATFAIQSYGASMYQAAELNDAVKMVMDASAELPEICACRLNSDYNYTDTRTKRYRYQAVFDITHY